MSEIQSRPANLINANWDAPARVAAFTTTRAGGVSRKPFDSMNLGLNSGDEAAHVMINRQRLAASLPNTPLWLQQVHGRALLYGPSITCNPDGVPTELPQADAIWTDKAEQVLTILTADCLPILLCDAKGQWVAAIHAGWRGLAAGIIPRCLKHLPLMNTEVLAWLGPGISAEAYEVDADVRTAFVAQNAEFESAFYDNGERWQADLYAIARHQLSTAGVQVSGGDYCTFSDPELFYSYRRDGQTGRMASVIYIRGSEYS